MRTTVSVRGQTVIPQEIRRALDIQAQSKLDWELREDGIFIRILPADPVGATVGLLQGKDLGTGALLEERHRERSRELL